MLILLTLDLFLYEVLGRIFCTLSIRIFLTEMIFLVTVYSESKFDQYNHLKFFSCLYYVIIFKNKQKSFISQTRMCIFLSYIWNSTFIYKIMNIATHHVFTAFSIWWDEQQFSDLTDQALINSSADFCVNLSASQTLIDQLDMSDTTNQSINDQNSLMPVFSILSNFNKHLRKSILFSLTAISTKKSCKIKFSIQSIF